MSSDKFARRTIIIGGSLGAASLFYYSRSAVIEMAAEGEIFVSSLIRLLATNTHAIVIGALGNCLYDFIGNKNCAMLNAIMPHIVEPAKANTPLVTFSMKDVENTASQYGVDASLCKQTARIVGTNAVIDCLHGQGAIWYQKNETGYDDVNKAKITVTNLTDNDISPRISIGLYDAGTGYYELELIKDIAPTINPHDSFVETIYLSPKITLKPGFKTIKLSAFLSKRIDTEDMIFSKTVSIIVCPAVAKNR